MNWEIELIAVFSSTCYLSRWVWQVLATKKAKQSVNPLIFWVLTWFAVTSLAIYGYLMGSVVMPLTLPISWIIIFYNARIEWRKKSD